MNDAQQIGIPPEVARYWLDAFIPTWHVCASGPTPFGQVEPVHVSLNFIVVKTREEAEQELYGHLRYLCEEVWKREFDPDEWQLVHCAIQGGN